MQFLPPGDLPDPRIEPESRSAKLLRKSHIFNTTIYKVDNCYTPELTQILKEMGIPDHITLLLRNLYAGQETTVRTRHGTTDWFPIRKGVRQGCILSLCLFNLYAEYIMRNAGLEEAQAGIKIARRNISNFRYADDTILMTESKEELNKEPLDESERRD